MARRDILSGVPQANAGNAIEQGDLSRVPAEADILLHLKVGTRRCRRMQEGVSDPQCNDLLNPVVLDVVNLRSHRRALFQHDILWANTEGKQPLICWRTR